MWMPNESYSSESESILMFTQILNTASSGRCGQNVKNSLVADSLGIVKQERTRFYNRRIYNDSSQL